MKTSAPQPANRTGNLPPVQWRSFIWYLILMLGTLWVWQEAARQVVYRTIPYSEFKADLEHGEVVECSVGQAEIQGKVQPKAASATEKGEGSTTAKTSNAANVPPPETDLQAQLQHAATG